MTRARFLACLAVIVALWSGASASAPTSALSVFAAASLKDALDEIAMSYETRTGTKVIISYAASSALARQIEFGAPADVYISASSDWMDHLDTRGDIDPSSRFALAGNRLALVGPAATAVTVEITEALDLPDMLSGGRLAMGLTEAVPAGIYGKAALEHLGLWTQIATQVAQTDNVRAALALVSLGAAPLGIVYATDAQADDGVAVLGLFPEDSHPLILYPVARVSRSRHADVERFLDHLRSPEAAETLARFGFLPPPS